MELFLQSYFLFYVFFVPLLANFKFAGITLRHIKIYASWLAWARFLEPNRMNLRCELYIYLLFMDYTESK